MKVDFTGRGVDITPRIKTFTEGKLERLRKHLDEVQDMKVILSSEKYRQQAEIKFLSQKRTFVGSEESTDMFHAIDSVIDKLESQVKKHKQKRNSKKRNTTETIRDVNTFEDVLPATEESADEVRVIRADSAMFKPMDLDEAVEELTKLNREFIIFRNSESDLFNVVYRRTDGHIGFVEPEG